MKFDQMYHCLHIECVLFFGNKEYHQLLHDSEVGSVDCTGPGCRVCVVDNDRDAIYKGNLFAAMNAAMNAAMKLI